MPKNWKTYKLSEIATLRKKNIAPNEFGNQHYIGLEHIGQGNFLLEGIGKSTDATSNKSVFLNGDILYGKIRPYFKKVYRPRFEGICSTDILVIKSKNEVLISQEYLYQIIKNQEFTDKAIETSTGTKMPRADWNSLGNYEFTIPPLPEQTAIASILSAIDDKIENNLQTNKTLEEMAMALYKHWFVDFGPFREGEFVDSELGRIPKGWEVKSVGDLYKTTSGGTPSRNKNEYYDGGFIPWVKSKELYGTFVIDTEEKISQLGLNRSSAKLIPAKSVLIAMYGATVGESSILSIEATCNQAICGIIEKDISYIYVFLYLRYYKTEILNQAVGSAQQNISQEIIKNLKIISPLKGLKVFERLEALYNSIEQNLIENQTLTTLRDTLLPKLISGEVRVKDFAQT
ncbi:MAG: restriction endonuclease subunit S [Bacteroidetes bacterium]|nr:restriction endonuclease subunit S [Bacteroidota bacterium]